MKYGCDGPKMSENGYREEGPGLIGINDTCYGICASYAETNDTYVIDPECAKACTDFVNQRKEEMLGVSTCDHQVPYRPPVWENFGRYFPKLLRKGMAPNDALTECKKMCNYYSPMVGEECSDACLLDYNALEIPAGPSGSKKGGKKKGGMTGPTGPTGPIGMPSPTGMTGATGPVGPSGGMVQSSGMNNSRNKKLFIVFLILLIIVTIYMYQKRKTKTV